MTIKPSAVHTLLGVVVGFILFMLTFGVEQYYRYHVSNLRSLDGKEHSFYIYPHTSVDSVLNMVRKNYDISGELDLRWHMRLKVFKAPKPGYYVLPAEMGDKLLGISNNWGNWQMNKLSCDCKGSDRDACFEEL